MKNNLKNNLRVERAKKDMTQAQLAEKSGLSRMTIMRMENGDATVTSVANCLKVAGALECRLEDILILDDCTK